MVKNIVISIIIIFITNIAITEQDITFVSNLPNYDLDYSEVLPGEPDWHDPDANAVLYGGHHHVIGDNVPQSYIDRVYIFAEFGEMFNRGEITQSQLDEMDYACFALKFGTTDKEIVRNKIWEYYETYVKR